MNKQTKMYLGLGLLAVAGYYFWNKSKTSSPKANVAGNCTANVGWKTRKIKVGKIVTIDGDTFCQVDGAFYRPQ
jgi:hypothetical protein